MCSAFDPKMKTKTFFVDKTIEKVPTLKHRGHWKIQCNLYQSIYIYTCLYYVVCIHY